MGENKAKYEYLVRRMSWPGRELNWSGADAIEKIINELAQAGWKLVAVSERMHYFERDIRPKGNVKA